MQAGLCKSCKCATAVVADGHSKIDARSESISIRAHAALVHDSGQENHSADLPSDGKDASPAMSSGSAGAAACDPEVCDPNCWP